MRQDGTADMSEKWVFFDLDGTLTRSEEGIWNSVRYAAERMGVPVPDQAVLRRFIGPPLLHSFREYMGMTEKQAARAQEIYRERYTTIGKFENRVYPGVRSMLRALRDRGVRMGVVTGKPEISTRAILDYFGLSKFMERISCATDALADKEHLIRAVMPAGDAEVWMVGDRCFDMEGGVKAGVHTLGAAWGYGSEEELRDSGAERIARSAWEAAWAICPDARRPEGAFLSMEGLDGSGKSTQIDRLTEALERFGFEVEHSREPGGTPIAEKIREILLDPENREMTAETEALLYAAARAQHVRERIRPAVAEGRVLLCDRFLDSSVAYQGGGRELGVDRVLAINAPAVGDTLPLLTVFLDLDHRESLRRRGAVSRLDRIEAEEESFHARVEEAYHELISRHPERYLVVDAREDRDSLAAKIAKAVLERLMARE